MTNRDNEPFGPAFYSPDYLTARERFREATHRVGWQLKTYPCDLTAPNGETLSVDVAISPGDSSAPTLVVSSGLHGVEGMFGSAVQLAWLKDAPDQHEHSVRQVLIHTLNPYGFAWSRRVNEGNIDLNRNFLVPGDDYSGCPKGYRELNSFLNPHFPPSHWEPFTLKSLYLLVRHGKAKLQQAIAVGQYEYPQGLFFGGKEPAWQQELFASHLTEWIAYSPDVVHLDLHTGLGAWGTYNVLIDYPLMPQRQQRLQAWLGSHSFKAYETNVVSYQARGGLGHWLVAQNPDREYTFAVAEFGTYAPIWVLKGLRIENQAHHWGDPASPMRQKTKTRLSELFCPADPVWRQSALRQGLELLKKAHHGLQASLSRQP